MWLVALDDAEIKYSTVQNWYPGDKDEVGASIILLQASMEVKTLKSHGHKSRQTQQWHGSILVILQGDALSEFYSIAITNNHQKADTGTKMIHLGKNTKVKLFQRFLQEKLIIHTRIGR